MSAVQIAVLNTIVYREREREYNRAQIEFEENLLINNPALYKFYKETKDGKVHDDEDEDAGVEWIVPKTAEEAQRIAQMLDEQAKKAQRRAGKAQGEGGGEDGDGDWFLTSGEMEQMQDD